MDNLTIRNLAREAHIPLWKIADALGIADSTFSRKLRYELPEEEKQRILSIIRELGRAS